MKLVVSERILKAIGMLVSAGDSIDSKTAGNGALGQTVST
jgi:hypothetical protein